MNKKEKNDLLVFILAYNEQDCIGLVVDEVREHMQDVDILVVSDGSTDQTCRIALEHGAKVLDLPCNVGVGGAVQAGLRYAYDNGYPYAVRCDGDGQHSPADIKTLYDRVRDNGADLVIGSRFLSDGTYRSSRLRHLGIWCLASVLSVICRKKVTDPTSGFQAFNRVIMYSFSKMYPSDYPEPEALALMRRQGYEFAEVPAKFRKRMAGRSSIQGWGTFYYMVKVLLALMVDRARPVDEKYAKWNLKGEV